MNGFEQRKGEVEFVLALASGRTVRDAAATAGISESTAYRRMRDPAFCRRVAEVRRELIGRAAGRLADLAAAATNTLARLLEAESETAALGAARTILDQAGRFNGHPQDAEEAVRPAVPPDGVCTLRFDPRELTDEQLKCVMSIVGGPDGDARPGEHLADDDFPEPTRLEDDAVEVSM